MTFEQAVDYLMTQRGYDPEFTKDRAQRVLTASHCCDKQNFTAEELDEDLRRYLDFLSVERENARLGYRIALLAGDPETRATGSKQASRAAKNIGERFGEDKQSEDYADHAMQAAGRRTRI